MSSRVILWESWALSEEADRRFRRILLLVGIPFLILAILLSIFQMEIKKAEAGNYNGSRYAELVVEQPGEVAPPEQPKPAEKNQQEKPQQAPKAAVPKPTPVPVPTETAREKAQKEMKVFDQLNDLRDQKLNSLNDQPLVSSTITSKGGVGGAASSAEAIAQSAAANSGGGIGGSGSVTSTQSGTGLGSRRTGTVQSPIGNAASKVGANGKVADARTLQEIQEVFDRNKGPLTAIYMRQSRENPNMGDGKIVVRLTIAPDGSVTQCSVVSSSFNDPDFEHKIVQRILLFRFAPKNVPPFTYNTYPIEFHPM